MTDETTLLERTIEHVRTLYPEIVVGRFALSDLPVGGVIGTWSYSIPHRLRVISDGGKQLAPGVLPGDLARQFLRETYHFPIRRRDDQKRRYTLPIFARPGVYKSLAYVDIRSAYRSIIQTVGYNTDYRISAYLISHPVKFPPEIAQNKLCYALLAAMSANKKTSIKRLTATGVKSIETTNIYANVCLYAFASELLAAIAGDVINSVPTYYVNTDGYIVPLWAVGSAIRCVKRWGFDARVKVSGPGEIRGIGSYTIGAYTTRRIDHSIQTFGSPLPTRAERKWINRVWLTHRKHAILKIGIDS